MTAPIPDSAGPRIATDPEYKAPVGAVDTHIHMLAGPDEFPLWENRVENPAPGLDLDGFIRLYRAQMRTLGITRTVVVHSIVYGEDNSVTLAAIKKLGVSTTRGIGLLRDGATEAEIERLRRAGIMGIRLNYVHGGVLSWEGAKALAPMLAARGMHLQLLINAHRHMRDLFDDIRALPMPVVLDHIGWPNMGLGPSEQGFHLLLHLLSEGHIHVKLSGLYRLAEEPYTHSDPFVASLVRANPQHCLWGSDWPFIMLGDAKMPDAGKLLDAFHRTVPSARLRRRILVDNPAQLYQFED